MNQWTVLPDAPIAGSGPMARVFLEMQVTTFLEACGWVHQMPYGYNSNKDDLMILFKEKMGTRTTKHAVSATLAHELGLSVEKHIGIYAMTEAIVSGTQRILDQFQLPYLPMIHCFLVSGNHRVDLTEGNRNGKNGPISEFLHTEPVIPNIAAKDEYLKYRTALKSHILTRAEFAQVDLKVVLQAREAGLVLLKANLER